MKKLLAALFALTMMVSCSSEPPKPVEKPQPKPPEYVTGRTAFQKVYVAARGWARDAQPYRLESLPSSDSKGHDGKSAIWRASFASATQRGVKPYVWSGTDVADAPSRGVNPGTEDNYNPNNASTTVFDPQFLKIDSDQAFDVAQKHGGDKLLEKTPDLQVKYTLDWDRSANILVWHISYGTGLQLNVAVNASTGDFLRAEK